MTVTSALSGADRPGPRTIVPVSTTGRPRLAGLVTSDLLACLLGGLLAFSWRFWTEPAPEWFGWVVLGSPLLWVAAIATSGAYELRFLGVGTAEYRRMFLAAVWLLASVGTLSWAVKEQVARGYMAVAVPLTALLAVLGRYLIRRRLYRLRSSGTALHRVVAVGHPRAVTALVEQLRRDRQHGLHPVAACLTTGADRPATRRLEGLGVAVAGSVDSVVEAVAAYGADTVVVSWWSQLEPTEFRLLRWELEQHGVDLLLAPPLFEVADFRVAIRPASGVPLLHVQQPELSGTRRITKGLFDRLAAIALVLALAPLLITITLLIRLTSPGPALFRQRRAGLHGEYFTVYKFRTMVAEAESLRSSLVHLSQHGDVPFFKIRADPRITPVGNWLRKYSLDELPQLFNVVLGQMSLVGPRPQVAEEVASYGVDMRRRLLVKPGLTGLWQVSGRNDLSLEESVRLDVSYVENWSLLLDFQILARTAHAVVRGAGAY